MKKCINCGNKENNNASACSVCGGILMKEPNVCRNCGAELDGELAFCTYCGTPVNADPMPTPMPAPMPNTYMYDRERMMAPASEPKKGKGTVIALSIIAALLLVACLLLGWYIFAEKDNGTDTSESDTSSEQQNGGSEEEVQTETEKPKVSTYSVKVTNTSWSSANALSMQNGGHLVYVNSYDEFVQVCNLADSAGIKVFWMGACRSSASDSWYDVTWNNGESLTYTKWYPGEPSYSEDGVPEKYLMAFKVKGVWYFNDAIEDVSAYYTAKQMGYIIEFEQ